MNNIKEVKEDLINVLRFNEHHKDKNGNNFVNLDVDHINYLIKLLEKSIKGEE